MPWSAAHEAQPAPTLPALLPRLFYTYSFADEERLRPWPERLHVLREQAVLGDWDGYPFVYEVWRAEVRERFESAALIIFFASADLRERLRQTPELLARARARQRQGLCQVFVVPLGAAGPPPVPETPPPGPLAGFPLLATTDLAPEAAAAAWDALALALRAVLAPPAPHLTPTVVVPPDLSASATVTAPPPAPRLLTPAPGRPVSAPALASASAGGSEVSGDRGAARPAIGRYHVLRPLDEGGMGRVYLGQHPDTGRKVAIKVLRPELGQDDRLVRRFYQEAQTASRVSAQGAVQILDCGQLPEGQVFLVMELLEGESLRQRLRQQPRRGEALHLCYQAASVIAELHAQGIIHRDLKPENLMLVKDSAMPGGERVKILDFGIAKVVAERAVTQHQGPEQGTQVNEIIGTPMYMAPEQCSAPREVHGQADVYSLGIIMYEVLSGQTPFADHKDLVSLLAAHQMRPPPPLKRLAVGAPRGVVLLIERMLAKEPAQRPTMMEVAAELRRLGLDRPLAPAPPRRLPRPLGLALALPILLGLGAWRWWPGGAGKAPRPAPRSEEPPRPEATPPAAPLARVSYRLESKPLGATVQVSVAGQPLRTGCRLTPCALTLAVADQPVQVALQLEGYEERRFTLPRREPGEHACEPCQAPLILK